MTTNGMASPLAYARGNRATMAREDAAAQGLGSYYDGVTCPRGHDGASRYTRDGACCVCRDSRVPGQPDGRSARELGPRGHAIATGSVTFQSPEPCLRGHTSARYTSTGGCVDCLKLAAPRRPTLAAMVGRLQLIYGRRFTLDPADGDTVRLDGVTIDQPTFERIQLEIGMALRVKIALSPRNLADALRYVAGHPLPDVAMRYVGNVSDDQRKAFEETLRAFVDAYAITHGTHVDIL